MRLFKGVHKHAKNIHHFCLFVLILHKISQFDYSSLLEVILKAKLDFEN